jgi:hypothetical protein
MPKQRMWIIMAGLALVRLLAVFVKAVEIDSVTVDNPGNANDTRYETPGCGSVSYVYAIGKYGITAGQYCEFLNAVADADTDGLYNISMAVPINSWGCNIHQSGSAGS